MMQKKLRVVSPCQLYDVSMPATKIFFSCLPTQQQLWTRPGGQNSATAMINYHRISSSYHNHIMYVLLEDLERWFETEELEE